MSPHLYALGIWLFVALMNACVKGLHQEIPLSLIATSRFSIGLLMFLPAIYKAGGFKRVLMTKHPRKQVIRSILSMSGVTATFYAIPLLPLGDATALWNTLAFFLLLFSGPLLGEKIQLKHYLICAIGFIGVLFIAHPHGTEQIIPVAVMIIAAMVAAFTTLTVRFMSRDDHELTIITWLFSISTLISVLWFVFLTPKMSLSMEQIGLLIAVGLFGSISQLCMVRAFKKLSAEVMGPYTYSGILFSLILGFFFFDEKPTIWMMTGASLIIIGIQLSYKLNAKPKKPVIV